MPEPAKRNGFNNMTVVTEYSELLKEKNARNDSLLPALDGDKAFAEVLRLNPNFWSLGGALDKEESLVTKLNAKVIFIDGIREDPFCEIDKNSGNSAGEWNVRIGVDFVSGGSNTVHIHVQQCLDYVRDELGYAIKKGDKVVFVPPKKVLDKIKESEIPDAIDVDLQQTLLNHPSAHPAGVGGASSPSEPLHIHRISLPLSLPPLHLPPALTESSPYRSARPVRGSYPIQNAHPSASPTSPFRTGLFRMYHHVSESSSPFLIRCSKQSAWNRTPKCPATYRFQAPQTARTDPPSGTETNMCKWSGIKRNSRRNHRPRSW